MNYYAHGYRFVDRPHYLVGTAVPDLLRVSDKRVRVRSVPTRQFVDTNAGPHAEIAAGILQHLQDDDAFHGSAAFIQVSGQLTKMFVAALPPQDHLRPSFLGHIVTELILDALLIELRPSILDDYYRAFAEVPPDLVQQTVNQIAKSPAERLAGVIPLFLREQFLRDYAEPRGMWVRLNHVMHRVGLDQLPENAINVLADAWPFIRQWGPQLLPHQWPRFA